MIRKEAEEFGRWLAVDNDGTAHVFRQQPTNIAGKWVPDSFPTGCVKACVPAGNLSNFSGQLFKRRTRQGEHTWEIQNEQ